MVEERLSTVCTVKRNDQFKLEVAMHHVLPGGVWLIRFNREMQEMCVCVYQMFKANQDTHLYVQYTVQHNSYNEAVSKCFTEKELYGKHL